MSEKEKTANALWSSFSTTESCVFDSLRFLGSLLSYEAINMFLFPDQAFHSQYRPKYILQISLKGLC